MKVEDLKKKFWNTYGIMITDSLEDWTIDRRRRSYWVHIPRIINGEINLTDTVRYSVHYSTELAKMIKYYIKRDFDRDPKKYLKQLEACMINVKECTNDN